MSVLTLISLLVGMYIGATVEEKRKDNKAYEYGYEDGFLEGVLQEATKDFPTTMDGKFFSTEAALRSMSSKEGDS